MHGCDLDSRGKFISKDPTITDKAKDKLYKIAGHNFDIDLYGH